MPELPTTPSQAESEGFVRAQKLAYACAESVASTLEPGTTERETANRMKSWLGARGVSAWFHEPFAWFGDRTAFRGFSGVDPRFLPTGRKLEKGMPFILDCAPIVDGFTADIGFSGALGSSPVVDRLLADLAVHRSLILDRVRAGDTFAEVHRQVDRLCMRQGLEPAHKAYPFSVLAHRVERTDSKGRAFHAFQFGVGALRDLARSVHLGRRAGWSPLWNGSSRSEHLPIPGFWAVEPHLAFRGVGAKFEEILVITSGEAFWLDDDVPHVRRVNAAIRTNAN